MTTGALGSGGTVVFDGDCGFCTWSADRLRAWSGGRLAVVPWQRADLASLGLTPEECALAVQFVAPTGRFSGGVAAARALAQCRQPWRTAGRVLSVTSLGPVVETAYVFVAARRHRLPGATPACRVAPTDA